MHTTPNATELRRSTSASEQVVLGIALNHPEQVDRIASHVPPEAFTEPMHAELMRALTAIRASGNEGFTLAAIERELGTAAGDPDDLKVFLERLISMCATPGQLEYDLGVVREGFERRVCVLAMQQTIYDLTHDRVSPQRALDMPREHFAKLGAKEVLAASGSARGLRFVTLDALEPSDEPDWVWRGYVASGCITVLSAAPKAGKSTLLRHLLRDLYRGEGLSDHAEPMTAPTLIVSEETAGHWSRQASSLDLPRDMVHLCAQPFFTKPTLAQWERAIARVVEVVEETRPRLVIFDTLSNLWPVRDENSAAEVNAALMPLRAISATGAALVLVHHDRKSGGNHGEGARGSSAIGGFPDALLQLRRFREEPGETRRKLSYVGRFDTTAPDVVIELTDDGYRLIGSAAEVRADGLIQQVENALPPDGSPRTLEQIRELTGIGRDRLRDLLHDGSEHGHFVRTGSGRRCDPYRFGRRPPEARGQLDLLPDC